MQIITCLNTIKLEANLGHTSRPNVAKQMKLRMAIMQYYVPTSTNKDVMNIQKLGLANRI